MSRVAKLLVPLGVLGLLVVAGLAWWLGLFSSEPEEVSIESAVESVTADPEAGDSTTTAAPSTTAAEAADETTTTAAAAATTATADGITGGWTIEPGDATFVGYRIVEVLTTVGDFTAVGRTGMVSGSLTADGTTITTVDVLANLADLTSDNSNRDRQMQTQALESAQFPDGIFTLVDPIDLGELPADGETVSIPATGELTVHGVTNEIDITLDAALTDDRIIVVGSTDVLLSDYDIDPPQARIVASVEDEAVIELSLVFVRS